MRDFSSRPRRRGRLYATPVVLAVGIIALLASLGVLTKTLSDHRRVTARLRDERSGLQSLQSRLRSLESSRSPDQARSLQALLTLEATPPRVLRDLAGVLPADVRLNRLSLGYGNRLEVDMEVVARTASSYDLFLERLEDCGLFENIVPGDENREGELGARVQAVYRAGLP